MTFPGKLEMHLLIRFTLALSQSQIFLSKGGEEGIVNLERQ